MGRRFLPTRIRLDLGERIEHGLAAKGRRHRQVGMRMAASAARTRLDT